MHVAEPSPRDRARSIAAVALVHAALGYALLTGLGMSIPQKLQESLEVVDLLPPPPAPQEKAAAEHKAAPRKSGEASPANIRSKATEVVAPEVKIIPPPPLPAATKANMGDQFTSGATSMAGPGNGAGGIGNGFGSGGSGDGDGGGGGTPLRLLSGRIKDSDTPKWLEDTRVVHFTFGVSAAGRVTSCHIDRSSGYSQLDQLTCRLVTERFRYKPSRDASGRAVPDEVDGEQVWYGHRDPNGEPQD